MRLLTSIRNPSNFKDLFIHIGIMAIVFVLLILVLFYTYLPKLTNHGETITVPDVVGMTIPKLDEFLKKRNLHFEVTKDSGYSSSFPTLTVLRQIPEPDTKVKENRKIYVILNAEHPPLVRMPKMGDLSLKSAQMVLKSYDFRLGEIEYVPDIFFGVVHEAKINGRTVIEGERIEKGSVINLVVGDGYGNTSFRSPNLIGQVQDEAEVVIIGSGLKVGKVTNTLFSDGEVAPGSVQDQYPKPGTVLKIGDAIDLWIYKLDSINENATTILDYE